MNVLEQYYQQISDLLSIIKSEEKEKIQKAANLIAETVKQDKLVHIFGTSGHACVAAEDIFFRIGGLVNINPIFDPGLSLTHGALRAGLFEELSEYAGSILNYYNVSNGDIVIIINSYGSKTVTIEAAQEANKMGAKVIAITSVEATKSLPKRNMLCQVGEIDVLIDSHIPTEDAVVHVDGLKVGTAPVSTILNSYILNSIIAFSIEKLIKEGFNPPIWMNGNAPEGAKENQLYAERYWEKIKHL